MADARPPVQTVGGSLPPPGDGRSPDGRERAVTWIVVVLTALAVVGWMVWSNASERRAIARMPAEQRRVIYDHTMETLLTLCRDPDAVMRRRCREQAEFLTAFPECDDACRESIAPFLRKPAR